MPRRSNSKTANGQTISVRKLIEDGYDDIDHYTQGREEEFGDVNKLKSNFRDIVLVRLSHMSGRQSGVTTESNITIPRAAELVEFLRRSHHMAMDSSNPSFSLRTELFCTAVTHALIIQDTPDHAVEKAVGSAIRKVDQRFAKVASETLPPVGRIEIMRQVAAKLEQKRATAALHTPTDKELKANYSQALGHYKSAWTAVAEKAKTLGMGYPMMTLTDSERLTPYDRLNHADFLTKFEDVLEGARAHELIKKTDNIDAASHPEDSMIGLLKTVKTAHQALDQAREAMNSRPRRRGE